MAAKDKIEEIHHKIKQLNHQRNVKLCRLGIEKNEFLIKKITLLDAKIAKLENRLRFYSYRSGFRL